MDPLAIKLLEGERRALAQVLTRVENSSLHGKQLLAELFPHSGKAHIIGFTGSPGTGKSTLVNAVIHELRRRGKSVAVLAIDPSSPFTGGAVLGDRIRMSEHTGDKAVFIRSMASRGALGGLSRAAGDAITIMQAAGFDYVLVETVGAGQSEVEIIKEAQTVVVVEVPGLGDEVQAIKAGLLEIADIYAVNKADNPLANRTMMSLQLMLDIANHPSVWRPPIIKTIATTREGVATLVDEINRHRTFLQESGLLVQRERRRAAEDFSRIVRNELFNRLLAQTENQYNDFVTRIAQREIDPYTATNELMGVYFGK